MLVRNCIILHLRFRGDFMESKKKLSKYQLGLIIIAVLFMFLNNVFTTLYFSKTLSLTTYKYIFISFNSIIIIIAFAFKRRTNHIYRTLTIIMIGVSNLLNSIMTINLPTGLFLFVPWGLSLVLFLAFLTKSSDD